MFRMILRKIVRNKWLVLSLIGGAVVAVAMVASVPLYTDGILQRMLTRDLEQSQESSGEFSGRYTIRSSYYDPLVPFVPTFASQDRVTREETIPVLGLPVLASTNRLTMEALDAVPVPAREAVPKRRVLKLEGAEGAADHIRIARGRMYAALEGGGGDRGRGHRAGDGRDGPAAGRDLYGEDSSGPHAGTAALPRGGNLRAERLPGPLVVPAPVELFGLPVGGLRACQGHVRRPADPAPHDFHLVLCAGLSRHHSRRPRTGRGHPRGPDRPFPGTSTSALHCR